ncbi:MAG: YbjN domain-containing protein [Spirochaetota bacterium]|nr:YbjN domain-containing protein [Spirochaetota bacterium]
MGKEDLIKRIDDFLIELSMSYETPAEGMWVIHDEFENIDNIVVSLEDPLVIFRIRLMEIPDSGKDEFFEQLLRLNVTSLIHGAYALEDNHVVIVDTLQAENLDLNEFRASIEAIGMAIINDYKELSRFVKK